MIEQGHGVYACLVFVWLSEKGNKMTVTKGRREKKKKEKKNH